MNAHFVLRIATDRDWAADVRAQVQPSKKAFGSKLHFLGFFAFCPPVVLAGRDEQSGEV